MALEYIYTEDDDVDPFPVVEPAEDEASAPTLGFPFLPRVGVPPSSFVVPDEVDAPLLDKLEGMIIGSSNCPAGVRSKPPSGLNVNLRKKLVKLSSPYSLTFAQADEGGRLLMAGKGGIGDGERPYRKEE